MASIAAAARSSLRSVAGRSRRFSPSGSPSPFRISPPRPLPPRTLRSPVEMSSALQSLLPYHSATASALLNSMLSVAPKGYGWIIEDF